MWLICYHQLYIYKYNTFWAFVIHWELETMSSEGVCLTLWLLAKHISTMKIQMKPRISVQQKKIRSWRIWLLSHYSFLLWYLCMVLHIYIFLWILARNESTLRRWPQVGGSGNTYNGAFWNSRADWESFFWFCSSCEA